MFGYLKRSMVWGFCNKTLSWFFNYVENYFRFVVRQEMCCRCDFKLPAKLAVILCRSSFHISSSYSHYPCWVAVWSNQFSLSFPLNDYLYTYWNKFLVFLKVPICACRGIYNFHKYFYYLAFIKHANSEVQKPPSQLRFSLSAISHN